jgi:hypothetical protein
MTIKVRVRAVNKIEAVNLLPVLADDLSLSVKKSPKTMNVSSKTICPGTLGIRYRNPLVTPDKRINLTFPQPKYL